MLRRRHHPQAQAAGKAERGQESDERGRILRVYQKDAARQVRETKEDQLKATHAKKKEQWPPEVQEEYFEVAEAAALAEAEYEYRKIELKGINDSVKDLVESIQGKGLAGRKGTRDARRVCR